MTAEPTRVALIATAIALLTASLGCSAAATTTAAAAPKARPCRVLALGDSITASVDEVHSWRSIADPGDVRWVGPSSGAGTRYGGGNSWSSEKLAPHVPDWAQAYRPDMALILIGSNDVRLGHDPQDTADRVGEMTEMLLESGAATVIIGTIPPRLDQPRDLLGPEGLAETNTAITEAAEAVGGEVRTVDLDPDETLDGVHPNRRGKQRIAAAMEIPGHRCHE